MAKTKVFKDKDGNRLIFPELVQFGIEGDPDGTDIICKALMISLAIGAQTEPGWFEFDPTTFSHFETVIAHPNFRHGGASVLIFEGPQFDKYAAAAAA